MDPQYVLLAVGWDGVCEEFAQPSRLDALEIREIIRPDYAGVRLVERLVRDDGTVREIELK